MDSISSEIPPEVSDILIELEVIANIPTMHKFNTKTGTYARANSWIDAGWRGWYGEDCDGTINHINNKISIAIALARKYPVWRVLICERIANLDRAITNLKHTYSLNPHNSRKLSKFDLIRLRIDPKALSNACSSGQFPIGIYKFALASPSSVNLKKSHSTGELIDKSDMEGPD